MSKHEALGSEPANPKKWYTNRVQSDPVATPEAVAARYLAWRKSKGLEGPVTVFPVTGRTSTISARVHRELHRLGAAVRVLTPEEMESY